MKLNQLVSQRFKERPADCVVESHALMIRGGYMKYVGNGIFSEFPILRRITSKIEAIIREEMNRIDGQEVLFPVVMPADLWDQSGRYESVGSELLRFTDRNNSRMVLGMTHEEAAVHLVREYAQSYQQYPFMIYQIQRKFRDEARPRAGMIRVREFTMKDAYSFDIDEAHTDIAYAKMTKAYHNIFDAMELDYRVVKSDTGAMGGVLSEEYQALSDMGEDVLVICDKCDFSSNLEVASVNSDYKKEEKEKNYEIVETPGAKTIEEVVNFLSIDINDTVKTLVYNIDGEIVMTLIKGDRELNDTKLRKLLNATSVEMATEEELKTITTGTFGSLGPIGIKAKIIVDNEVLNMVNFVCGANKDGYHYINVNLKDFDIYKAGDIVNIKETDKCPICGSKISFQRGIEVGNTFKLGTKYSEALGLTYLDENNKTKYVDMGCYGIGTARCISAVVQQHHDENGIIWPVSIAPFTAAIVLISNKDEYASKVAEQIYKELENNNIDTLFDDRDERPGVKFKDMDLIGIPYRITVGKKVSDGLVELKTRDGKINKDVKIEDIVKELKNI